MRRGDHGIPPPSLATLTAEPVLAPTSLAGPLLVATEDQSRLEGSVRLAELIARRHRLNAHVLTVVRPMSRPLSRLVSAAAGIEARDLDDCRRKKARAHLRSRVTEIVGLSSFFSTSAKTGHLLPTASAAARGRAAKYVLTDLAPAGEPLRRTTAATAVRLAAESAVPVLAVPPTVDLLPRSALVCVDFTEASVRAALATAPLLAEGGELTLAHIAPPLGAGRPEDEARAEEWARWATTELLELADRLRETGNLKVYVLLLRGDAERVVTRSVRNVDLVAIGAPGPARPDLRLRGGVSAAVLRHAQGTILIAPDPARILQLEA
jgi:nucleotide-binding universal stress UspA family protein